VSWLREPHKSKTTDQNRICCEVTFLLHTIDNLVQAKDKTNDS